MESLIRPLKHNRAVIEILTAILVGYLAGRFAIKNQSAAVIALPVLLLGTILIVFRHSAIKSITKAASFGLFTTFVLLYLTGIPKMPPLPFSPIFFVIGIYLLYGVFNPSAALNRSWVESNKVFLLIALCWLFRYIVAFIAKGSLYVDMQFIELIGIAIILRSFIKNDLEKAKAATRVIALVFIASSAWFVMEQFSGVLPIVRYFIYRTMFESADERTLTLTFKLANGLSPYIFLFGYQIAAAVPLLTVLLLSEKKTGWKALWAFGSILCIASMAILAERSVVLASLIAILFHLYRKRRLGAAFAVIFLLLVSFSVMQMFGAQNIFTRIKDSGSVSEGFDRIWLQLTGLSVAFKNPLGLILTGGSWADEVYSSGADFSTWGGIEIGIHNSYIGRVIAYGWAFGALMIAVLWRLARGINKVLGNRSQQTKDTDGYADATAASLLSVLIQALFHNSSIFTFNSTSMVIMFFFLMWHDLRSKTGGAVVAPNEAGQ